LKKNPYGGLGFNEKGEHIGWHGGQVLFYGKLQDTTGKGCKKPANFKIVLVPAELGPSNMFARRFGSKTFFRLKLSKSVQNRSPVEIFPYLKRPIILCGGVFRAFYAKDQTVFYVKTNEVVEGNAIVPDKFIEGEKSLLEFCEWHNSLEFNSKQVKILVLNTFGITLIAVFRKWQNGYPDLHSDFRTLSQD